MTDISQAAKERAVQLANGEATIPGRFEEALFGEYSAVSDVMTALAKYIDKVSDIAKRAKDGRTYSGTELDSIIVADVDPIARAISSMAMPIDAERYGREIGESLRHLGYKIVKDEG